MSDVNELLGQLAKAVIDLTNKIDGLSPKPAETPAPKKRGRPAKPKPKPEPEPIPEEEEDDDEDLELIEWSDDDDEVYRPRKNTMAISTGIQRGKRSNNFDSSAFGPNHDREIDAKLLKPLEGKQKKRRPKVKFVKIRCSGCAGVFKIPEGAIVRGEKYRCNDCCQGGA